MTVDTDRNKAVDSFMFVHGLFLLGALTFLVLAVFGCGTTNFDVIRSGLDSRGHYIEAVPFVKQSEYDCGPAALASVLSFWGKAADLERITASVYLPKLRGTLPMDLERYAQDEGFKTSSTAGTVATLKTAVRSNIPVICLLDLGFWFYRQPHFVTVIGFDNGNSLFIMHDGGTPNKTMPYEDFEKKWSRAGKWMIMITPNQNLLKEAG
jgi:ABC-type bacteriocin/lantibiotic exporter with double-glycine peptidase domain